MGTVRRAVVAGALAFPLALGTAGIASADSDAPGGTYFTEFSTFAGPDGAGTHTVSSGNTSQSEATDVVVDATENTVPAADPLTQATDYQLTPYVAYTEPRSTPHDSDPEDTELDYGDGDFDEQ